MELTKEEDKIVTKFLENVSVEGSENLLLLMQFTLAKMAENAIMVNAGEIALAQDMDFKDERYHCRMSVQVTRPGKKSLEERAYEIVDRLIDTGAKGEIFRDVMQKAVLAGYSMHQEDFEHYEEPAGTCDNED